MLWNEDVIWRTRLEIQEWNLNQRAREQDVREANLRRRERRVQRRETELRAARIRGRGRGRGRVTVKHVRTVLCIFYFPSRHVRSSLGTTRLVIKCSIFHAIIVICT